MAILCTSSLICPKHPLKVNPKCCTSMKGLFKEALLSNEVREIIIKEKTELQAGFEPIKMRELYHCATTAAPVEVALMVTQTYWMAESTSLSSAAWGIIRLKKAWLVGIFSLSWSVVMIKLRAQINLRCSST